MMEMMDEYFYIDYMSKIKEISVMCQCGKLITFHEQEVDEPMKCDQCGREYALEVYLLELKGD